MTPSRVADSFPVPSYRGTQRAARSRTADAFAADNDVVFVRAPTGGGTSNLEPYST